MTEERERLLADLEAIAASIQDPAKRQEVQRIIARLSHQAQKWPDDAEMIRLRLKSSGSED
jgi:cytochrome c-type biogenesis protein CcmH/NrfG